MVRFRWIYLLPMVVSSEQKEEKKILSILFRDFMSAVPQDGKNDKTLKNLLKKGLMAC